MEDEVELFLFDVTIFDMNMRRTSMVVTGIASNPEEMLLKSRAWLRKKNRLNEEVVGIVRTTEIIIP